MLSLSRCYSTQKHIPVHSVCTVIRMYHLWLWRILQLQSKNKASEEFLKSEVISNQEVHSIIKTEFSGDVGTNRSEPT